MMTELDLSRSDELERLLVDGIDAGVRLGAFRRTVSHERNTRFAGRFDPGALSVRPEDHEGIHPGARDEALEGRVFTHRIIARLHGGDQGVAAGLDLDFYPAKKTGGNGVNGLSAVNAGRHDDTHEEALTRLELSGVGIGPVADLSRATTSCYGALSRQSRSRASGREPATRWIYVSGCTLRDIRI